jgi:hypothetical protein
MSAYTVLRAASQTLKQLLLQRFQADPDLNTVGVSLRTPREMGATRGVSLWLYRVVRNEFCLNTPPRRIGPAREQRSPLPVGLHYLVTPLLDESESEQQVLGKILQVFHDHPVVRGVDLQGSLEGTAVELRVTLETLTLEELTRIWDALKSEAGYELSVSYEVQVVEIDSALELEPSVPVLELVPQYHIIVGSQPS